ncbi:rod shape-determining protein [Candidatus Azambacteria bacterium]|nr:rod shape-determining protein [Candidatus Azambacteria bacterium]MBI3685194.1 rod shape-determining protein [Candidatus Azambacteria bacterium]
MFIRKIGIDLGTTNTLVFIPKRGVVVNEPSVVAVSAHDKSVMAVGAEAKEMLGRTPDAIIALRPLKEGVIADYKITEAMISYFLTKGCGRIRFFKPEMMISVPAGITSTERRAVVDAAMQAGAKAAYVVKEPVLAAIGAGIPINEASGNMIINIGGGTSEIAVISLGGIVAWSSVRVAGNKIDEAITEYMHKVHNLEIGERTAENVKITIGSAVPVKDEEEIDVRGRDIVTGLPRTVNISTNEVADAIAEPLKEIVRAVKSVLQDTPPELAADIMHKGMVLSGGGALLRNIDQLLFKVTGVACTKANDPLLCVARGTGIVLENLDVYKRSVMSKK